LAIDETFHELSLVRESATERFLSIRALIGSTIEVRFGSWLCENAKTLDRDRTS
jgi:hypothetical protein